MSLSKRAWDVQTADYPICMSPETNIKVIVQLMTLRVEYLEQNKEIVNMERDVK